MAKSLGGSKRLRWSDPADPTADPADPLRMGLLHYNTREELDRVLLALRSLG